MGAEADRSVRWLLAPQRLTPARLVSAAVAQMAVTVTLPFIPPWHGQGERVWAFVTCLSTWALSALWAHGVLSLRWPKTPGWRIVASGAPLAMCNSAISCAALLFNVDSRGRWVESTLGGLFLGASVGAIIWVPALLAFLLLFTAPLLRAVAAKTEMALDATERLGSYLGTYAAAIGLATAALAALAEKGVAAAFALFTAMLGLGVVAWASVRRTGRRRFCERVAAGTVQDYRVVPLDETEGGDAAPRARAAAAFAFPRHAIVRVAVDVATYRVAPEKPTALATLELDEVDGAAVAELRRSRAATP